MFRVSRARWAALVVALAGCGESPPAVVDAAAVAAPDAAVAAGPSVEERRARFEGRAVVALPGELPGAWAKFVRAVEGRPTKLLHEVRTASAKVDWRAIELDLRVFGEDAAVEARLVAALGALGLPGVGAALPAEPVSAGPVRWSVGVDRLVAPVGEPREQIVRLRWRRVPEAPAEPVKCRKPLPVDAPAAAPGWLAEVTSRRTTRQRITAASRLDPAGAEVEMRMLFRNGFAHDEHVGHLTEGATRAGFARVEGEGPRQRWRHPDGAVLSWAPDTADDLELGCTLAGPVLAIAWRGAKPGAGAR